MITQTLMSQNNTTSMANYSDLKVKALLIFLSAKNFGIQLLSKLISALKERVKKWNALKKHKSTPWISMANEHTLKFTKTSSCSKGPLIFTTRTKTFFKHSE